MMGYGWGGGLGFVWMIGGLLVMIGIVLVVVWAAEAIWHGGRGASGPGASAAGPSVSGSGVSAPSRPTPDEILRERFARGEITQDEYEGARRVLGLDR